MFKSPDESYEKILDGYLSTVGKACGQRPLPGSFPYTLCAAFALADTEWKEQIEQISKSLLLDPPRNGFSLVPKNMPAMSAVQSTYAPRQVTIRIKNPDGTYTDLAQPGNFEVKYDMGPAVAKKAVATPAKPKRICKACPNELSETMDAYYGKHPDGPKYCDPCRRKLRIP